MLESRPALAKNHDKATELLDRVDALVATGRMKPSGLRAFEARDEARSRVYSHEREAASFSPAFTKAFKANANAWTFWSAQPPGYRKVLTHWITSAKKDETRSKRLATVIEASARERRLG